MSTHQEMSEALVENQIPDFAALLSQNKNYRKNNVSRIVARDVYRKKENSNNSTTKTNQPKAQNDSESTIAKRVVYKVNEDGFVSCVPDECFDAIARGEDVDNGGGGDSDKTDSTYYIVGGHSMEDNLPPGLSKEDYFIEKSLGGDKIDHFQSGHFRINTIEESKQSRNGTKNKSEKGAIFLSKNSLLIQDLFDIEATTKDTIKLNQARKLAYKLSLRTKECSTNESFKTETKLKPLILLNNADDITVNAMTEKERKRLEGRRKIEESRAPHYLHGIELQKWESKIDWEGANTDLSTLTKDGNVVSTIDSQYLDPEIVLSQTFNTSFEGMDLSKLISWEGADAKPGVNEALGRQIGKIVLQDTVAASSVAKISGANPTINPRPFNQTEEYKNRMENKAAGITAGPISSHQSDLMKRNKEIEERQRKRAQREIDKTQRITNVFKSVNALRGSTGRAVTSSLMGPGGTERTGRPSRHHGSSQAHDFEYIEQLDMISNHSFVKADMSPVELRHYCRPLLPRCYFKADNIKPWQLKIVVAPQKKRSNGKGNTGYLNVMPGSISQSKIRTLSDLCPSEGHLVVVEYSEEKTPIKLMKGMASKIINYYRGDKSKCPVSAGGGDLPTKKKKHGLTNQDSDVKGSSGKVEMPPRLEGPDLSLNANDLIGKINQKKKNDRNAAMNSSITKFPEGVSEILKDHGPFLGKVTDGATQTGLINNLFIAPMVRHEPRKTDFIMILGSTKYQSSTSTTHGVILRPMPTNVFIAGQTEPKRKVYAPDSKGDKDFIAPYTTYQIAKALQSKHAKESLGLKFEEIKDGLFPFNDIPPNPLRQRIKKVALYDKNTQIWTLKNIGFEDFDGIDSLGRQFLPEGVAVHWSARCADQYLRDIGLQDISSMSSCVVNIGIAMKYLAGIKNAARKRKKLMNKIAKSRNKSKDYESFVKAKAKLLEVFKDIKRRYDVANFIFEELQLTPWNLSTDFMDVHRNPSGTGTMQLTGLGDPSGVSAGFNFMRATERTNRSIAKNDNKVEITGTNKDLRKLSMPEMARILLEKYGIQQKLIQTLNRWDRVHMIRELSTKAASDNAGDGMERYARVEKIKLRDKNDSYKKRIQEIWERQKSFLQETEDESNMDKNEVTLKEENLSDDSSSSSDDDEEDDDDDEDVVNELQNMMQDTKKKNELLRSGGETDDVHKNKMTASKDAADDAGDLAAFQREHEETRALNKSSNDRDGRGTKNIGNRFQNMNKKVIRKKITKTHPDGTQTVTFQFIVDCDEELIMNAQNQAAANKRKVSSMAKKKTKKLVMAGHTFFEEEVSSVKLIPVRQKRGGGGRGRSRRSDGDYVPTRKSNTSQTKTKQEKKKKKRKKDDEDEDIYTKPIRRSTSNRKGRDSARELKPHAKLAERLEAIRYDCEKRPESGAFLRPVSRSVANYYESIIYPIDLQTIRDKIKSYKYQTADNFTKDFETMKNNAIKFNGVGSQLAINAENIYEFVKRQIDGNRSEFAAIEKAVEDQFGNNRKRPRSASPKQIIQNPASVITVDGVEQKVYLGEIQAPFQS